MRAGTANIFIRFAGCNLRCSMEVGPKSPGGFDCDTEFESSRKMTLLELYETALWTVEKYGDASDRNRACRWLILTGGEPGLQVDKEFCDYWHKAGFMLAIETNGTVVLPHRAELAEVGHANYYNADNWLLDWITLSPKVAEHAVKQLWAHEIKYVRGYGQGIPKPTAKALNYLISPAFEGNRLDPRTLQHCIQLVKENPQWRLSVQMHKEWMVR